MNNYVEKYRKIVNRLINNSFPNLKNKEIIVTEFPNISKKYSAGAGEFLIFKWIIVLRKCRKYSNKALIGLLAHELSHCYITERMGLLEKFIYFIRWVFSKRMRAKAETQTDLITIKKGYGEELILLRKGISIGKTKEQLEERAKRGYLSLGEIKTYMKKLGK